MLLKRFQKDIKKYFGFSIVSAKAQLKSEVANSYLNWLWWVLDPICFMLIYTFIFGYVFKAKEPYFPVFIFIGLSMWDFFNRMINQSVRIVKTNKPIVSKVYLPKYILVLTKIWVNLLLFTFACSIWLLHYGVFVEDLSNVVMIALRMLFYLTGIFYNVGTRIPAPYGEFLLKYNPMAFFLECMRNALLYGKIPHRKLMLAWFLVSIVLTVLGIRKIYKNENSYVKVI